MGEDPAFVWESERLRPPRPSPPRSGRDPAADESSDEPPALAGDGEAVLVPLDEWSRILRQLGNLYEAGRELAEARERAAKAETESSFLRERLRDMRDRLGELEAEVAKPPPEPEPLPSFGEWFVRRWLERRNKGD